MGGRGSGGGGSRSAVSAKMPELQGSAKQVSWANDIRSRALQALDMNIRNAERNEKLRGAIDGFNPSVKSTREIRSMAVKMFQGMRSAKEFIDRRYDFTQQLFKEAAAEIDFQKGRMTKR